eukprot:scaffold50528_cov36-Phaeocystis_antarctica.AAC.1
MAGLRAEDGEDELEGADHAEDIADGGHRLEERGDDQLHPLVAREQPQRAEHAQDAQLLERSQRGDARGEEDEERDPDDEEVEHVPRVLEEGRLAVEGEAMRDHLA